MRDGRKQDSGPFLRLFEVWCIDGLSFGSMISDRCGISAPNGDPIVSGPRGFRCDSRWAMVVKKPWGGRFTGPTDELVESFTSSIEGDQNIALDDVDGSLAHASMLADVGILSAEDGQKIASGLHQIRQEIQADAFVWDRAFEDVHMNIERRLAALVGESVAGRLHTARSRNDQVALDIRLFLRRRLRDIAAKLTRLERALVDQAEAHVDVIMPGYTHLQRAQPVRLAHHLLAYREMFKRDRSRVKDVLERAALSPLGSGALAGTPHPIDRGRVAEVLGFSGITANSMDSVADRDSMLETLSASAISMVHLSRLSEEIVLFASSEFGFIEIDDAFTTGSSMMPQKKNPDVAELVRGKCGRVVGDLVALLVTMKGLPMTYNRDMQEDKPPLYDSLDTWSACLEVTTRMIPAIRFRRDRLAQALRAGFVTATELADHLVREGVPFRESHEVVGRIVAHCVKAEKTLDDLSLEDLRGFNPAFAADALTWIDVERAVDRRDLPGGPARGRVLEALRVARAELEGDDVA